MKKGWPAGVVVRRDEPLAAHSPYRVGGTCEALVSVHSREALASVLKACKGEGYTVTPLGACTRVVYGDGPVRGALLQLGSGFATIERGEGSWWVGAAVPVPALIAAGMASGCPGFRALTGVSGTFGGALKNEQGSWRSLVRSVVCMVRGREREVTLERARQGRALVLGAHVRAVPGEGAPMPQRDPQLTPGCWWEPVEGVSLRSILRRAGLPGVRLRGICIPLAAPETFANVGGGTAADIALLQRSVIERIKREQGLTLVPRVRLVGRSRRT